MSNLQTELNDVAVLLENGAIEEKAAAQRVLELLNDGDTPTNLQITRAKRPALALRPADIEEFLRKHAELRQEDADKQKRIIIGVAGAVAAAGALLATGGGSAGALLGSLKDLLGIFGSEKK
jgi:hypothetical protein